MLKSKKRLWIVIIIYVAIIYLSLSSVRSFLNFLYSSFGEEAVGFGINTLLVLSALAFFTYVALSINDYQGQNRVAGPQPQFDRKAELDGFQRKAARRVEARARPEPCPRDGRKSQGLPPNCLTKTLLKKYTFTDLQYRVFLIMIVLLLGGVIAINTDLPVERIHFLEYGILGYLVFKAATDSWRFPFIYSFFLVFIIGAGDETIQWFLPDRVGEMRDVFMNCFGGLLGISIRRLKDGMV